MNHTTKKKIREILISSGQNHCRYCYSTENLTLDHIHPKILGGGNKRENFQILCECCNQVKSGAIIESPETFYQDNIVQIARWEICRITKKIKQIKT